MKQTALTEIRKNIREIYALVEKQAPQHHFEFHDPFWVLITTMMSHRTKDEVTDAAARSLYIEYHDAKGLSGADPETVLKLIRKVGFSKTKAPRIVNAANIIVNNYGGKVPASLEELMKIPGVGRKTANVVLADSFRIPAIAVDTHVHRISKRFGISRSKNPEAVEKALMKILPRDLWVGFNPMFVEFGKKICKPIGPLCGNCSISKYCSFFSKKGKR